MKGHLQLGTTKVIVVHRRVQRHAVMSDFEDARLPGVSVEHIDGPSGIFSGGEKDGPVSPASVIRAEAHIGSQDGASFSKQVLQILPTYSVRQVSNE